MVKNMEMKNLFNTGNTHAVAAALISQLQIPATQLSCCACGRPIMVRDEWLKKATTEDLAHVACSTSCLSELLDLKTE